MRNEFERGSFSNDSLFFGGKTSYMMRATYLNFLVLSRAMPKPKVATMPVRQRRVAR